MSLATRRANGLRATSTSDPRQERLTEFEGLRGLLAAWVIFGHILLFSGYAYASGLFGILFSPVLGVYVFMTLSGFVITFALDARKSSWLSFMKRRFFRIYPVYALSLLLAISSLNVSQYVADKFAPQAFAGENSERLAEVNEHFPLYVLADASLLQTLLPRPIFPHAHETFLPPTWSLSLEWLFYLVMPLLMGLLRRAWLTRAIGFFGLIALVALFHEQAAAICPSLSLANGCYFLCGIASYFLWKHLPLIRGQKQRWAILSFWTALGFGLLALGLSFKIWIGVLAILLYRRVHSQPIRAIECARWFLTCPPLKFLGQISYSSYLLHWIVIEICLYLQLRWIPQLEGRFPLALFCCATVFPLTYAASHLIYKYVERPMIDFGSQTIRRPATSVQCAPA